MSYPDFFIVVTGWNCKDYVKDCIDSIKAQDYPGIVNVHITDDASDDETLKGIVDNCMPLQWSEKMRFDFDHRLENCGATFNRHKAIVDAHAQGIIHDETIIVFVGLDDRLMLGALRRIAREYMINGKWMTYGNWINQHGKGLPFGFEYDFPKEIHEHRDYRKVSYRSTAPNTFYFKLYKQIPSEDLMLNGEWLQTCTEGEVMYSCLEMCGRERIGIIRDRIYFYNEKRPGGSIEKFGAKKAEIINAIRARKKKPLYEDIIKNDSQY